MSDNIFADIYNRILGLFGQNTKDESKNTAVNRLRLVLMQDRTNLTPEIMNRMRTELINVLSKYVVLDKEALDLNIGQEGEQMALMLSIPVVRAKNEEEIEEALKQEEEAKKAEEKAEDNEEENKEEASEETGTDEESETKEDSESKDEEKKTEDEEEEVEVVVSETIEETEDAEPEESTEAPSKKADIPSINKNNSSTSKSQTSDKKEK